MQLLVRPADGKILRREPDGYVYGTQERAKGFLFRVFPKAPRPSRTRVDTDRLAPQDRDRLEESREMRISTKEFEKLCA